MNAIKRYGLPLCLLLTAIVLCPVVLNGWVNWDDHSYIQQNALIHGLTPNHLKAIFVTSEVLGSYHPLTLLSYALEYSVVGNEPFLYHLDNLLLHLLNVALVFAFFTTIQDNRLVALLCALLFGIHPLHVESVAWVSARKDLLFTLFFLISMIGYVRYLRPVAAVRRWAWYGISVIAFALSLLSKSMAITLPFVLFLLDYFLGRQVQRSSLLDKAPYFIGALIIAVVAVLGQQEGRSMHAMASIPFYKTVFVGAFNLLIYAIKVIVPYKLSAFHPYPFVHHSSMPWYVYLAVVPVGAILRFGYSRYPDKRLFVFSVGFFVLTLLPVLKILPFGRGIMADRYSYLPYLGLFFLLATWVIAQLEDSHRQIRVRRLALAGFLLLFAGISFGRTFVWKNGETLWRDVIKKYPGTFMGHVNLADYFKGLGRKEEALDQYSKTLEIGDDNVYALLERGRMLKEKGDLEGALADFNRIMEVGGKNYSAYINRALLLYSNFEQPGQALADLENAIALEPFRSTAYLNSAVMLEGLERYEEAESVYTRGIQKIPRDPILYRYRGVVRLQMRDIRGALEDFSRAIELNPIFGEAYFLRSVAHKEAEDYDLAIVDAMKAEEVGYRLSPEYITELTKDPVYD